MLSKQAGDAYGFQLTADTCCAFFNDAFTKISAFHSCNHHTDCNGHLHPPYRALPSPINHED